MVWCACLNLGLAGGLAVALWMQLQASESSYSSLSSAASLRFMKVVSSYFLIASEISLIPSLAIIIIVKNVET